MKTLEMYNNIIAALCTWREARGESAMGKLLVAMVIVNRAKDPKRWPNALAGVVLQPKQFTSFSIGDRNAVKIPALNDGDFISCCIAIDCALAEGTLSQTIQLEDKYKPLLAANHYHDDSIDPPSWTKGIQYLGKVGKLLFYKG